MDPRWNPITLMVLGAALMVFTYTMSFFFEGTVFSQVMSVIVLALGALTMASGVVLAYLQMFRDQSVSSRFGRR